MNEKSKVSVDIEVDSQGFYVNWPKELTESLLQILGRPASIWAPFAHLYRQAGIEIPKTMESEQAYFTHMMLRLWFQHGDNGWKEAADVELETIKAAALAKTAAICPIKDVQ